MITEKEYLSARERLTSHQSKITDALFYSGEYLSTKDVADRVGMSATTISNAIKLLRHEGFGFDCKVNYGRKFKYKLVTASSPVRIDNLWSIALARKPLEMVML